mgnify:CR=1 FL=1
MILMFLNARAVPRWYPRCLLKVRMLLRRGVVTQGLTCGDLLALRASAQWVHLQFATYITKAHEVLAWHFVTGGVSNSFALLRQWRRMLENVRNPEILWNPSWNPVRKPMKSLKSSHVLKELRYPSFLLRHARISRISLVFLSDFS